MKTEEFNALSPVLQELFTLLKRQTVAQERQADALEGIWEECKK